MPAILDHMLWGGPNLERATTLLVEQSGVRPAFGGHHPDLGTHNALAALGDKTYLEVLAPDPTLPHGALARQLHALPAPALIMWAARTRDAAATAERARQAGYRVTVVEGHRPRPDGVVLRWTNVFVGGHGAGTLAPFFIQWHTKNHPADDAPVGLHLRSFVAETPDPAALRKVLTALDVKLTVRRGERDRLVASIETPKGDIELSGP